MKKSFLFFFALVLFFLNTNAQNQHIIVGNNYETPNAVTLIAERGESTTIQFDLNELDLIEVATNYGLANLMMSGKTPVILEAGVPELIYLPTSIIIPDVGSAELSIEYGAFTEIENIEIAPSKGSISRSVDPETIPYIKGEVYNVDAFFPGKLAELNEPFIMRDVRGQTLFVYPVQYNPVTKTLRIYSEITVTANYTENEGVNEFTTQKRHSSIDPSFNQMYHNLFINSSTLNSRDYPTGEDGELLIICHPAFMDDMLPYINWKRTIGRKTTMVSTATSGTTSSAIKTYIAEYYNNPDHDLAYVLFVGDNAQIPACPATSAQSDVEYGKITGNDNYLEILIGRMSCETNVHVQTQVQRTIEYERDMTTDDTWLSVGIGLSAYQCGGHFNECDNQHIDLIRDRLLDYGYTTVHREYYGVAGLPNATKVSISQKFNDGVSVANYCNHGSMTGWEFYPFYLSYTNTEVNQLQNAGMLPYIFSVACQNGKFMSGTCFAEAWMRASQNGQPTGAIATFMATVDLNWSQPMYAQDEFVNICLDLPSTYSGQQPGIKRTIAGAMLNASQKMLMLYPSDLSDYNSWLVFGDPTLQFRTKTPTEMTVSYLPLVPLGAETFTVECDADGATAAISYIDENEEVVLLGAGVVTDGIAEIVFDEPLSYIGELTLAVTGFNKVTYIDNTLMVGGEFIMNEPQNLTCTVENVSHVVVNWNEPQGSTIPVKGYNVYRNDKLITFEPVRDEVTFTDIVSKNGEYTYTVTALYNNSGSLESEPSEPKTVTVTGMCVAIERVIVQDNDESSILVSWEKPNYEGIDLAGYNVYRDNEKLNEGLIPATELSFVDENLELGTQYCYQVEVVYNDCKETLITDENCQTLSIRDISGANNFVIYPNPANNVLYVTMGHDKGINPLVIEIYDIYGRNLTPHTSYLTPHTSLDISDLPTGLYFVKIYTETNDFAVKRLVIMK